jgi:hypothetical protein
MQLGIAVLSVQIVAASSGAPALEPAPPRPSSAELLAPLRGEIDPSRNRDMGAPGAVAVDLGDALPAAGQATVEPGPLGDSLRAPASGDPSYLGFAAARYYPPVDERVDPALVAQALAAEAAGRRETYGFVMLASRLSHARRAALEALGVRVLGFHPYACLKVALPASSIDAVGALDFVRWVGVARPEQKLHPRLADLEPEGDGRFALYVDLFESDLGPQSSAEPAATMSRADAGLVAPASEAGPVPLRWRSNGRMQAALDELGIEVREYVETIQAFRVRCAPQQVEALAALDFVQFVEPDLPKALAHDESTPMIATDLSRAYFSGNSSGAVSIGQGDSGVDVGHGALGIWGWGWDFTGLGNAFADGCEHGTHVMGTILGDGAGSFSSSLKGVAPGLARSGGTSRAYVARIFNNGCGWSGVALATLFDVYENSYWDGVNWSNKPQLVSNSWGTGGVGWFGTEAEPRTVDNQVYDHDQLYLFAAGNDGSGASTILLESTAKNALTVGAVVDYYAPSGFPSAVADFSSRGPCGDGRWKPNVVAPGTIIRSVDANSGSGYRDDSGTSMATPHVAGLAAQIADGATWTQFHPETVAAILMSSAETKGGVLLSTPADSHLDNYGTGRVQASKAILGSSDYWWNTWIVFVQPGYAYYGDFAVPAGCRRVTVCMNYYEPAASAGASQALVNNWDLYIDDPYNGIDPNWNTGDWFAQQSSIDNCEIRSLDNPTVGTWRWKAWPTWVPGNAKMAVTVTYELDTAGCNPAHDVYAYTSYAQPNQPVDVYATVTNYDGLASGVSLDYYDSGATMLESQGTLYDGPTTDHLGNPNGGRDVELGDIPPGWSRSQRWRVSWPTEGYHWLGAYMDVDNYGWTYDQVNVTVDGTPPSLPSIGSTSHASLVWSTDPTIDLAWATPYDNLSGVFGYAAAVSTLGYPFDPGTSLDFGAINSITIAVPSSAYGIYFSMRPVDNCGNWTSGFAWSPPYLVDADAPSGTSGLYSVSHTPGVQSCTSIVSVQWSAASDAHSGLAGYLGVWDTAPSTDPTGAPNLSSGATSYAVDIGSSTAARYFHLRAKDVAGNYGATQHFGPVYANAFSVATYCTGKVNSLGCTPAISSVNQPSKSAGNFTVYGSNVINNRFGLLFWGVAPLAAPFQGGWKCVADPVVRTPIQDSGGNPPSYLDCSGTWSWTFDWAYMTAYGIDPGDTLYAQWWGRDPAVPSTTSLSNAIRFTVCQ